MRPADGREERASSTGLAPKGMEEGRQAGKRRKGEKGRTGCALAEAVALRLGPREDDRDRLEEEVEDAVW
jgi:hypothetical protein